MIDYIVVPLGEILSNRDYEQKKIEDAFKKFSCQRENDLEDFLNYKSIIYEKSDFGKTFLFLDKTELSNGNFVVIAYFTIAQKSIDLSGLSNKKKRKVFGEYPGRDSFNSLPAYLIGQLGRSDSFSGADLPGEVILNECYHAISIAARYVGGSVVILECREHMFEKFYKDKGYKLLYDSLNDQKLYTLYQKISFSAYWNS